MREVAIIGASGAVGNEILKLLEVRKFPVSRLRLFASPRSSGKTLCFQNTKLPLEMLTENAFQNIDLAFFAAGSSISKEFIPKALSSGTFCIDSSSYFRMDETVPLVIPEINAEAIKPHHRLIASPNCAATILLMPLAPLHHLFTAKRIIVSTYQAASGGGAHLLKHLQEETAATIKGEIFPTSLPFPYAFNLFPHTSKLHENGYVEEEIKILEETRKILCDSSISLSATCVRVPVLRAHSLSANVEFTKSFTLDQVYDAISQMPGVTLLEDRQNNRFPTPHDATGKEAIFVGRLRMDISQKNTLEFWAVGDQLLKGAALNAVQIAEKLLMASPKRPICRCH